MAVVVFGPARARADEPTLPRGVVRVSLDLEMTAATRDADAPWTLAPDVYAGVTPRLTVGVAHGFRGRGLVRTGGGVCVRECDDRYANLGLDARYRLGRAGGAAITARGMLLGRRLDPFHPALLAGVRADWRLGRWTVTAAPQLELGLARRDTGNGSSFNVPVTVAARAWRVEPYLFFAIEGPTHEAGERYDVPVAVGARVWVTEAVELGAQYGFRRLLGPLNTPRYRDAVVFACWRSQILW